MVGEGRAEGKVADGETEGSYVGSGGEVVEVGFGEGSGPVRLPFSTGGFNADVVYRA
jgi:hypothetical protein